MDLQQLAQQAAGQLTQVDQKILTLLGIKVIDIGPHQSKLQLVVRDDLVNGANVCQGGIIFTLADFALAYAAMTNNFVGATQSASIIYTNPSPLGDRLTAEASVSSDSGRGTAAVTVQVVNQDGLRIAQMQGVWRKSRQQLVKV